MTSFATRAEGDAAVVLARLKSIRLPLLPKESSNRRVPAPSTLPICTTVPPAVDEGAGSETGFVLTVNLDVGLAVPMPTLPVL